MSSSTKIPFTFMTTTYNKEVHTVHRGVILLLFSKNGSCQKHKGTIPFIQVCNLSTAQIIHNITEIYFNDA